MPASAVPDLVDARGRFRANMARSGAAMFFLPQVRRQMRAEIGAQLRPSARPGSSLITSPRTSIFTCIPRFFKAILELAKEFGVPAVRAPFEPAAILAQVGAADPHLSAFALAARLQRAVSSGRASPRPTMFSASPGAGP